MAPVLVLTHGDGASLRNLPKPSTNSFYRRPFKHTSSLNVPCRLLPPHSTNVLLSRFFRPSLLRVRSFQGEDADNFEVTEESLDGQNKGANEKIGNQKNNLSAEGNSFLLILAIAVGVAAIITITSIGLKWPSVGSFFGVQSLAESSTSSALASPPVGFTFKAFGYRIILPEYAPGWIYFWLLMAAGCGLFISEEALNIWVGITLSRMLSVDGTWQSFVESFSRNAPYIMSTVFWVYWGVCISDMIPFYLGKLFRESGATDDICSKLGIGEEKVSSITHTVQQYGNLAGIVERFSLGVRNPTAFLAGTLVSGHHLYKDCAWEIGYISGVFLCWSLLWWLDHPSTTARYWISIEGTPGGCPCHCCHSSGHLDHISICCGCFDSIIPLR
ncbi:uncharacterized protein LOC110643675 isoform X2 [Hevea brasiliensis]|uniref:uncharacterized protein LOC110643675 isoform X2 n=1 Tax=Hevea brasiliensis TaxID=3981 RepID=UPI0025DBE5F8|nr:uncharacterized protein LOC110643675 isoform X2 [Hevea brasiliensis]